jgi:hypothetical protein
MLMDENFNDPHVWHNRKTLSQDSRVSLARHSELGLASRACHARRACRVLGRLPDLSCCRVPCLNEL